MMFVSPRTAVRELELSPGMHVADLGAGAGHYALEVARCVGDEGHVFAVDVQRELLKRLAHEAVENDLKLTTVIGDIERLRGTALRDEAVDAVLLSNVLFQLERKLHALEEAQRILKPGGKLLIIERGGAYQGTTKALENFVEETEACSLLEECGLTVDRRISAGGAQYGLIVCKR